jgi:hypothetical protein
LIDRLVKASDEGEGSHGEGSLRGGAVAATALSATALSAADRLLADRLDLLRGMPADLLVDELERRGWSVSFAG